MSLKKYLLSALALTLTMTNSNAVELDKLEMPEGFSINVYAKVKNARQMSLGENGTVYVGSRRKAGGRIFALLNPNREATASEVVVIDKRLKYPSGLTYKDGDLYVAAISTIYKYNDIADNLNNEKREVITDQFPTKTHHGWKFIEFGPDGKLYIPVGAPCNICLSEEPIYATINRMDVNAPETSLETVAHGVRNTVGFDWDPKSGELWFTDNGGDGLGDEMPADELNKIEKNGSHFGYPFIHQGDTRDPEFGDGKNAADYVAPAQKLVPHAGAVGMAFYKGDMFPEKFKNNIIIAEHGSWNRSDAAGHTGHRLTLVTVENGKATSYEPFISGWLQNNEAWGRPSDILELEDGSLLIADDEADVIYRVTYNK